MNESDSADENIIDENLDIHVPTHSEQNLGEAIVHCELLPNPVLEKNTKKQMQAWLRLYKVPTSGNKQQLMERYVPYFPILSHPILKPL